MVQSGLVDTPHVDHIRLAFHLSLALLLLQYTIWNFLSLNLKLQAKQKQRSNISYRNVTIILVIQIIYGAFTAGLKAGYGYNTYPTMSGEWLPIAALQMIPFAKPYL